jgi:molybdenum cofactor cytidylyltransferase
MNAIALVLAAGSARRFGGDKLSAPFRGEPLLAHAIRAARAAPVERVVVVTRPGQDIGEWPGAPPVERLELESEAMSASLKAGIAAAGTAGAAFVFLGDMPLVPHPVAARLSNAIGDAYAAVPRCQGKPGHPVLLSARAFADVAALTGDRGAGPLLKARGDVAWLDVEDGGVLQDVDRAGDIARLEGR